jgi:cytochrome c oxidase cbb3-type subunit 1
MSLEGSYGAGASVSAPSNTLTGSIHLIDKSICLPSIYFIASSVVWLLLASISAVVLGIKLLEPSFLNAFEALTYGRLQGVMKSSLLMGWIGNAIFAIALWIMARLSAKAIAHGGILIISGVIWNAALTIGILGICIGDMTAFSWFELPTYASGLFMLSYTLIAVWALVVFRERKEPFSFVSQWFILGALLWFPWIYMIAQFFMNYFPARGVMQSIVHAWSVNNVFYLFVAPIGLAAIYYLIPKLLNVAIRSYHLTALAFWSYALFSSWSAFTQLIGSPIPVWLITTSIVASIALIVPISIFFINILGTISIGKRFTQIVQSPVLKFVTFGAIAFLLNLLVKLLLSIREIDSIAHFTFMHEGLSWHLLYAFFSMIAFGIFYYLLPILLNRNWASNFGQNIHFTLSVFGISLLLLSMYLGGWIQGQHYALLEMSFLDIAINMRLWFQLQCLAFSILFLAHFVFLVNVVSLLIRPYIELLLKPFHQETRKVTA